MTGARLLAGALAVLLPALFLSACGGTDTVLNQARTINQSNHVSDRFEQQPVVLDDPHGFETSQLFFDSSEVIVLTDDTPNSQLRAASVAVVAHAPVILYNRDIHAQVIREIERLGAHTVFSVGNVPVLGYSGHIEVIRDPGGLDALQDATSLKFTEQEVADPSEAAAAVAALTTKEPVWLKAGYGGKQTVWENASGGVVPLQSRKDASMAPQVIALASSPLPSIATARAFGAKVYVVSSADPRSAHDTLLLTAGLADKALVAIGKEFGSGSELAARIREAEDSVAPGELDAVETLPQSAR